MAHTSSGMEYYLHEETRALPISHKANYGAYPTPDQPHHLQLYPRTFATPNDQNPSFTRPLQNLHIASPMASHQPFVNPPLDTRGLELTDGSSNYYIYDDARTPELAPSLPIHSPRSFKGTRSSSGRESPSLAGAFGSDLAPSPSVALRTLRVVSWSPQVGDEGTSLTIFLHPLAITAAPSTPTSSAIFGPGSPSRKMNTRNSAPAPVVTRRFRILFGSHVSPTTYSRSSEGLSSPDTALVALTTFVPSLRDLATTSTGERALITVQVVDENSRVLEDVIVGDWEIKSSLSSTASPSRGAGTKRRGEDLISEHGSPARRNPLGLVPMSAPAAMGTWGLSPQIRQQQLLSPLMGNRGSASPSPGLEVDPRTSTAPSNAIRHPPLELQAQSQPELIRTSQIPAASASYSGVTSYSNKAVLKLDGDLGMMAVGWTNEEWTARRRLVQFWRSQDGGVINATFRPIAQSEFIANSIVISCIFRDDKNECYVTSVDTIYLLEALVGVRFSVEEKNRIRRNLEGFKPTTVSKSKLDSEPFFSTIMSYVAPRPRTIEKDVKVFPWKVLSSALKKIIGKYSATHTSRPDPSGHHLGDDLSYPASTSVSPPTNSHRELDDPNELQEQRRRLDQHRINTPPPSRQPPLIDVSPAHQHGPSHSRPGSFDFNALLRSSSFGDLQQTYDTSAYNNQGHHRFPSAEDYGVTGSERLNAFLPLNHIRSFSDGPRDPIRRSVSGSGLPSTNYVTSNGSGYEFQSMGEPPVAHYNYPNDPAAPWGYSYDPQSGHERRRSSASWKAQYEQLGLPLGMGSGDRDSYTIPANDYGPV